MKATGTVIALIPVKQLNYGKYRNDNRNLKRPGRN